MIAFDNFHFLRPAWFAALLPLAALLALLARGGVLRGGWDAVCDRHLLPFILIGGALARRRFSLAVIALAGVIAITALAGPAWERLPQPVFRDRAAMVVALDLSRSMDATDVAPSRLARAVFKISDVLARRKSGQTALVVYAAQAFVVVPLTDDNDALALYLQSLATDLLPVQGSRPDRALQEAGALLMQAGVRRGDVLLVGDYADARAHAEARHLVAKGYRLSVLGVGTGDGAPVPLTSGDFLNAGGETVISTLAADELEALASAGGGIYRRLNLAGDGDTAALTAWLKSAPQAQGPEAAAEDAATTDVWRERGPWLLLLLAPLAAAAFRRGVLVVAVAALLPWPPEALAFDWRDLWLRPDQQAARALEAGDAEDAARLFEDRRWKAAAQYRNEDFEAAARSLESFDAAADLYNRGNALAKSGALKEAVAAYKGALELRPGLDDARHNLRIVEQLMQQRQQQQQQQAGGDRREGEEQRQQQQQQGGGKQQQQGAQQPQPPAVAEQRRTTEAPEAEGDAADAANAAAQMVGEDEQAVEQYLRRISEDPRRLLQRKLRHLSRLKQRETGEAAGDSPW